MRIHLSLLLFALLSVACVMAVGCEDDNAGTDTIENDAQVDIEPDLGPPDVVDMDIDMDDADVPISGATALYGLEPGGTGPFPGNRFATSDPSETTGLRLNLSYPVAALVDGGIDSPVSDPGDILPLLNAQNGFSRYSHVLFGIRGTIDPDSLPDIGDTSGSVFFVRLDTMQLGERVDAVVEVIPGNLTTPFTEILTVTPRVPLPEGSTWAVVVTQAVLAADGTPLQTSPDFQRALAEPMSAAPELMGAAAELAPLREHLGMLDLTAEDIAVAAVFTALTTSENTDALRDSIAMHLESISLTPTDAAPTVFDVMTLPSVHEDLPDMTGVGPILRGVVTLAELRDENGHIPQPIYDAQLDKHLLEVTGTRDVPFLLVLPDDSTAQPYPIVVVQHGNGARKEAALFLAGHLARAGFAVAAIDHLGHGELDTAGGTFFDFTDPGKVRAAFMQSSANQLGFIDALKTLDIDVMPLGAPDGVSDLDLDNDLAFVGESLGGITGLVTVSLHPDVGVAVLNVTGAGLRHLFGRFVSALISDALVVTQLAVVVQTAIDDIDGINLAGVRSDLDMLIQAVIDDGLVSNVSSDALALAAAVPWVCPCPDYDGAVGQMASPFGGSALVYIDGPRHGDFLVGQTDPVQTELMRTQATAYIVSFFGTGTGTVEF